MGKIRQEWSKLGKKVLGTRFDMPNPKPTILFSILTLVKKYYIKVFPDKNSYLQWCESLVVSLRKIKENSSKLVGGHAFISFFI